MSVVLGSWITEQYNKMKSKSNAPVPYVKLHNNQVVATSLNIAEVFGKEHYNVVKDIRRLLADTSALKYDLGQTATGVTYYGQNFNAVESYGVNDTPNNTTQERGDVLSYGTSEPQRIDGVLKEELEYYFEEPDFIQTSYRDAKGEERPMYLLNRNAVVLLVMSYTGAKALQFKLAYMQAFDHMYYVLSRNNLAFSKKMTLAKPVYNEYVKGDKQVAILMDALTQHNFNGFSPLAEAGVAN